MTHTTRRAFLGGAAAVAVAAPAIARKLSNIEYIRALHQRLICLDTHLDTPARFPWPGWDIMQRHAAPFSQVDYPRMVEGGLDGGFWAIFTTQGPLTPEGMMAARDAALLRAAAIREMVAKHGDHFALAFASGDAAKIDASGKKIVYQSIENAYPLGNDVTLLRSFYALGVRLCGFAHFKVNQFADSATDAPKWKGLSPAGHELLALMNELGVVPDHSHSSDDVFDQLVAESKTPILLSHSGCRAVHDHPRNLDDARLKTLADKGGVIQINSLSAYLVNTPDNPAREKAAGAIYAKLRTLSTMTPKEATAALAEASRAIKVLDVQYPETRATFEDYMAHILHALKTVGVEHVGI
ncbi:MAG: membrane dipeptidase, partial [Alphaproteobacteria bacterium]|nr:membrane dipeptidase [Alphaproteobacteria bacterium]